MFPLVQHIALTLLISLTALISPEETLKSHRSDDFVDSIGVALHFHKSNGAPETNWPKKEGAPDKASHDAQLQQRGDFKQLLQDLGVRHVRSGIGGDIIYSNGHEVSERVAQLYQESGIQLMNLAHDEHYWKEGDPGRIGYLKSIMQWMAEHHYTVNGKKIPVHQFISGIEGPNEQDSESEYGPFNAEKQSWLKEYMRLTQIERDKYPVLREINTLMWSPYNSVSCRKIGNIQNLYDIGNLHPYLSFPDAPHRRGVKWGNPAHPDFKNWHLGHLKVCNGDKPFMITETGYGDLDERRYISQDVKAKYTTRQLAEYFKQGIQRTYVYEFAKTAVWHVRPDWGLIDVQTIKDGVHITTNCTINQNKSRPECQERVHHQTVKTLTPLKPYYAIKNLIDLAGEKRWNASTLSWENQQTFIPKDLKIGFNSDLPSSVQKLLLQKQDGSYLLMMWNEVVSWRNRAVEPNSLKTIPTQLALPSGYKSTGVLGYDHQFDIVPIDATIDGKTVTLNIPDSLVFVKIVPQDFRKDERR